MSAADSIISRLPEGFEKARATGDLLYFDSIVHSHSESNLEFEIRLCPALQKKTALPSLDEPPAEKSDPFAPPYIPNLHVGDLKSDDGDEYAVLFNKYSVIPHHFLLVTKEFKSQSSPLYPSELVQTYQLLLAARKVGKHFIAFYNCGANSGASQLHKHLQFIPIEDDGPPIERLARSVNLESIEKPFALAALPYANHVYRFPPYFSPSSPKFEQTLSQAYLFLLDLVISTIRHDPEYPAGKPSYNMVLTLEHMHLIPRRRETYVLEKTGEAVSVNALGFAGMLLVKSEEELEAVKSESVGNILKGVGVGSVHELQVAGSSYEGPSSD
jgi:ATP adenylyltransferase